HCSGCGVPLAVNRRRYRPSYWCPTPGCDRIKSEIDSDVIDQMRGVAESYVEAVFRAVARAEHAVVVEPDLSFFESALHLRSIPQVDQFLKGFLKDDEHE